MSRKKLLQRIKHMMQITEERGATEAEALTATKKIGDLLEKYNLSMNEVEIREATCIQGDVIVGKSRAHPVTPVAHAIAVFVGVKLWKSQGNNIKIVFFGLPHDVEAATYFMVLCQNAMEVEWASFKNTESYANESAIHNGNSIRTSFMHGMAKRLSGRINEMHLEAEQTRKKQATSTALILVKNETIDQDFKELSLNLKRGRPSYRTVRSESAYDSGEAAANSVALNRGIA